MTISSSRRWRSSERIALGFLEELGYRIIETRRRIKIHGIEVSEIDAIVEDENGDRYGVEIKAGRIDVTGIRQAYVNAVIAGVKPMVVAKGFADDAAAALAEKLGVKVLQLSDYFLVETEELELLIRDAIDHLISDIISILIFSKPPSPDDIDFLRIIAREPTIMDASKALNKSIDDVIKRIRQLQNKGILPKGTKNYRLLKLYASLVVLKEEFGHIITQLKLCISEKPINA